MDMNLSEIITQLDKYAGKGMEFMQTATMMIALIAVGVIIGLFGLKLSRVWAAFIGLVIGAGAGAVITKMVELDKLPTLGVIAGCALVLAILFCVFFKVGVFFFLIFLVAGTFILLVGKQTLLYIAVGFAIGLVVALLAIKLFDPIVILITSAIGGLAVGLPAVRLAGMEGNLPVHLGVPAGVFLIFALIQFIMRSRQIGKKQAEKADEMKVKASRENEVEEARMVLDGDLDDIEDGDLDDDYYDDSDDDYYLDGEDDSSLEDDEDFTILDE